jgi:hypothetical protein
MPSWLPLLNYSTKYNISLSTLRRRIKARAIEFRLDQGKYLILDEGVKAVPEYEAPPPPRPMKHTVKEITEVPRQPAFVEASVLSSANRLVEEIKSAYAKILQEKEEQISQLKEEISDLRMLVRILEDSKGGNRESVEPLKQDQEASPQTEIDSDTEEGFNFGDFQNRTL